LLPLAFTETAWMPAFAEEFAFNHSMRNADNTFR
jgi:hypothetical protein